MPVLSVHGTKYDVRSVRMRKLWTMIWTSHRYLNQKACYPGVLGYDTAVRTMSSACSGVALEEKYTGLLNHFCLDAMPVIESITRHRVRSHRTVFPHKGKAKCPAQICKCDQESNAESSLLCSICLHFECGNSWHSWLWHDLTETTQLHGTLMSLVTIFANRTH